MPRDYTAKIPKKDLVHGAYYRGRCRNALIARWDANEQKFKHWRTKFGSTFIERICHPEDDQVYDVFVVERTLTEEEMETVRLIKFPEEK
jgi:hypothetical protein